MFRDCQGAVWDRRKVRRLRGAVVADWSLRRGDSGARWSGLGRGVLGVSRGCELAEAAR